MQLLKEAIVIAIVIAEKPSQMIRLDAYTLSNRVQYPIARLRLEAYTISKMPGTKSPDSDISNISWLEASTKTHCSLLTTHCSLLTTHCSLLIAHYSFLTTLSSLGCWLLARAFVSVSTMKRFVIVEMLTGVSETIFVF